MMIWPAIMDLVNEGVELTLQRVPLDDQKRALGFQQPALRVEASIVLGGHRVGIRHEYEMPPKNYMLDRELRTMLHLVREKKLQLAEKVDQSRGEVLGDGE